MHVECVSVGPYVFKDRICQTLMSASYVKGKSIMLNTTIMSHIMGKLLGTPGVP